MRSRVLAVVLLTVGPCLAADEPRVSLEARGEPLRAVLKKLTTGTATVITVEPKVPDVPVRLALRSVTVDHALRLIVKQAGKSLPQLEYETAEHGFRVYFATPVAPLAEMQDPNKFTVTVRKQPPPEAAPPEGKAEPETGEVEPGEQGAPTEETGQPEPGLAGPQPHQGEDFLAPPPYLIDPVAPYYAREALIPKVPYYRPGYLPVIAKTPGKRRRDVPRQPYYFRQQVLSGQTFPGRYGGTGPRGKRRNNNSGGGTGGGSGPGGFGRRPL